MVFHDSGAPCENRGGAHSKKQLYFYNSRHKIINVVAFLAYGGDKLLAKLKEHQPKVPRLPEKNLLLLALVGGGVGAWLGMELFRHKTQHRAFRICVPLFTLIWIVVVGGLYLYFNVIR